jgi:hypothetical protein
VFSPFGREFVINIAHNMAQIQRGHENIFFFNTPVSLFPVGRIFGQITQKRPLKNFLGRKKLDAVKLKKLAKCDRKETGKIFSQLFRGETM